MRLTCLVLAVAASASCADFSSPPDSKSKPLRLWYPAAGSLWNESMPIGNGRLGGMIRGGAASEIISTNEDSFWSGTKLNRLNKDANSTLKTVQSLLLQGKITEAQLEAALGLSGTPTSMREYMPGGDLQIIHQGLGSIKGYERWLDLQDATAGVYFTSNDIAYKREYFASEPAGVLAIRITASTPGSLNLYIKFQRPSNSQNRWAESAGGEGNDSIYSTYRAGDITAVFGARLKAFGGTQRQIGDNVQVMKADEVWIYSDTETTVRHSDPASEVKKKLDAAVTSTYAKLREEHVADYQKLFNRTALSLGSSSDQQKALATDARRQALAKGTFDPEFVSLYFQYGRYLLISSSRAKTYPANLQGIWNNDLNPAWGSKYTININLEMNYWPAEVANLQELTQPLFDLLETTYESGKTTAAEMYGAKGWLIHHNTDIFGDTAPQDIWAAGTYWPMGGVWLTSHIMEHYRFTGDKAFLEKYYYLFHAAAEFAGDFLTDYKGWKVTNPSCSPEHSYKNGSESGGMTIGSTMDNSLLWELFTHLEEATTILGKPLTSVVTKAQELKGQLPPLQISPKTGRLMEWIEDFQEAEPGHRHMSHLYGVFPGYEITPANKTIWDAAEAALAWRMSNNAGNMGWSRAWALSLHARMFDRASVETDIVDLLFNLTHNSLLDAGPPAGFQIDGNFGGTAGIAESLLQSHNGVIRLLPALPPSSTSGSFSGLVARGGFVIGVEWKNGVFAKAKIESRLGNELNLEIGPPSTTARKANGTSSNFQKKTEVGKTYVLEGGALTEA